MRIHFRAIALAIIITAIFVSLFSIGTVDIDRIIRQTRNVESFEDSKTRGRSTLHTDPKIAILMLAIKEPVTTSTVTPPAYAYSLANKQRYARLHNYDFQPIFVSDEPGINAAFTKISATERYFKDHPENEWVWFLDLDAYVVNKTMTVESHILSLIPENKTDVVSMIFCEDWNGINTGSTFIRNNQYTRDLLEKMWTMRYNDTIPQIKNQWEQAIIAQTVRDIQADPSRKNELDRFLIVPQRKLNSYDEPSHPDSNYQLGDFVIHFPGRAEKDQLLWTNLDRYGEKWKELLP